MAKTPDSKTAKPLSGATVTGAKGAAKGEAPAKSGKAAAPLGSAKTTGTKIK